MHLDPIVCGGVVGDRRRERVWWREREKERERKREREKERERKREREREREKESQVSVGKPVTIYIYHFSDDPVSVNLISKTVKCVLPVDIISEVVHFVRVPLQV